MVDACKSCYATGGFYQMPVVKKVRQDNRKGWREDSWVDKMVELLQPMPYFRWFDSGDMYHPDLASKIYKVMERTPDTKHWLPTRMYKIDKFKEVLHEMDGLGNVVVRRSSDSIYGEMVTGPNTSTIIPNSTYPVDGYVCNAYDQGGKCLDCRRCWDKETALIAYPMHGAKGLKMIKMMEIT